MQYFWVYKIEKPYENYEDILRRHMQLTAEACNSTSSRIFYPKFCKLLLFITRKFVMQGGRLPLFALNTLFALLHIKTTIYNPSFIIL